MRAFSLRLFLALVIACAVTARAHKTESGEHSPLHDKMEELGRSLRQIKRALTDSAPQKAQLELADKLVVGVKEAAAMKPQAKEGGPADAERVAEYNKRMVPLVKEFERLREAIAGGKAEEAREIVESLYKMKEEGHEAMGVEEE